MHLSEIIVHCRANLAAAESAYHNGLKGSCAELLSELGINLLDELPGEATALKPADPEHKEPRVIGPHGSHDAKIVNAILDPEKNSQETQ